jgi:hypothetical protein
MNIFDRYIEMITSASVAMPTPAPGQAPLMGTLRPDGTYVGPSMVKRKHKRNKMVKKRKKINISNIMQMRPIPKSL